MCTGFMIMILQWLDNVSTCTHNIRFARELGKRDTFRSHPANWDRFRLMRHTIVMLLNQFFGHTIVTNLQP